MKIKVRGNSTFPVPYIYVDGIAIPVGAWHAIEVLDADDNPHPVVNHRKNDAGFDIKVERPNQEVIGRRTYQRMLDDGRVTIDGSSDADAAVTRQHVAAAQAEAARFAADLVSARAEKAGVEQELATKTKEHEESQLRVLQLEEDIEKAQAAFTTAGATSNAEAEGLRSRIRELEALIAKGEEKPSGKTADKGAKKADPI